jgi:parallel beta-helix repeat protein
MRLTTLCLLMLPLVPAACHSPDDSATTPNRRALPTEPPRASTKVDVSVSCGASVVADVRLEEDLACSGDGLFIDSDGIRVNLNGHTISGAGVGVGIIVRSHHDVSISNGTIRGFLTGIMVATSTDVVIKDNGFTQNREGVFLAGSTGVTIKHNTAWNNSLRGFMVRPTGSGALSTDNVIMDNEVTNNPSGILVFGQPGNTIKANVISHSSVAALDLTGGGASGNIAKDNLLTSNAAGIKFGPGWTGNTFLENSFLANTCGIQGASANNVFKENVFSANGADTCP